MLQSMDLNLLPVLEPLVATQSMTANARALQLSPPAVSRALARLRRMFGDKLPVKSGRCLVLTPRGEELRREIGSCLGHVEALVQPRDPIDLRQVQRVIRIRCNDVFAGLLASRLLEYVNAEAPNVAVSLLPEDEPTDLNPRSETIDMSIGGDLTLTPEMIVRCIGNETLVGVVRETHSLLTQRMTAKRFVSHPHVVTSVQLQHERQMKDALQKCPA